MGGPIRLDWDGRRPAAPRTPQQLRVTEAHGPPAEREANHLILGDNLPVLATVAHRCAGSVDLVYIDPPFDSNRTYRAQVHTGAATVAETTAYRDHWSGAEYLQMLWERLLVLHDLLTVRGVICVHVDHHQVHRVRLLLDEVFGAGHFVNELIWRYGKMSNTSRRFPANHDTILVYARDPAAYPFHPVRSADSEYRTRFRRHLTGNVLRYGAVRDSRDKLILRRAARRRAALGRDLTDDDVLFDFDAEFKTQDDVFYDISIVKGNAAQNQHYDTQKPERLLERLIGAFSDPGALVLDCFAGSGTTAAVANRLGRRWIAVDCGRIAVHTTRKRLLGLGAGFTLSDLGADGAAAPQLRVDVRTQGLEVVVRLTGFAPAVPGGGDRPDYWAVDFDTGAGFAPGYTAWRRGGVTAAGASHRYDRPGPRRVTVQALDALGHEARVEVPVDVR